MFIPIAVSHSPVRPKEDAVIVLRTSDNVTCFSLENWFTTDINKLVPKFVTKTITLPPNTLGEDALRIISQDLINFHDKESMNLIGGFQDKAGNMQLLMYKQDVPPENGIDLVCELFEYQENLDEENQRTEIETLIN